MFLKSDEDVFTQDSNHVRAVRGQQAVVCRENAKVHLLEAHASIAAHTMEAH